MKIHYRTIAFIVLITTFLSPGICATPRTPETPNSPATEESKVPDPYDFVFTLKQPTKYKLPKVVQDMIMFDLHEQEGKALLRREEYEVIYQDKELLRRWVTELMEELNIYETAQISNSGSFGQTDQANRYADLANTWMKWNQKGW
jgi:hypothetical protein